MSLTLTNGYPRTYDGPMGGLMYHLDLLMLETLRNIESDDYGWYEIIHDTVGTMCYSRTRVMAGDYPLFAAQETSTGDWWVSINNIDPGSDLWKEILEAGG